MMDCPYFTVDAVSLKPKCLHKSRTCDFLSDNFLSVPICTKQHKHVDPKTVCIGCSLRFCKCCAEKCPEQRFNELTAHVG